jgi:hypothetical protein
MDEILTLEQWNELQGRIRKLYPELTEADLQYHEAGEQDMLTMVAYSLRKTKKIMFGILEKSSLVKPLKSNSYYSRNNLIRQKTG